MWLCTIALFRCFDPSIGRFLHLTESYAPRKFVCCHWVLFDFFTLYHELRLLISVFHDPFLKLMGVVFFQFVVLLLNKIRSPFENVARTTNRNIRIYMEIRFSRRQFHLSFLGLGALFAFLTTLLIFAITLRLLFLIFTLIRLQISEIHRLAPQLWQTISSYV